MRSIVRKSIVGLVRTSGHALFGVIGCESAVGAELRAFIFGVIREGYDCIDAGEHAESIGCVSQVDQSTVALADVGAGRNAAHVDLVAEERSAAESEALLEPRVSEERRVGRTVIHADSDGRISERARRTASIAHACIVSAEVILRAEQIAGEIDGIAVVRILTSGKTSAIGQVLIVRRAV